MRSPDFHHYEDQIAALLFQDAAPPVTSTSRPSGAAQQWHE
jgi:hypothetical protein